MMKKKLFLIVLMASVFVCVLAISVSAKDISTGYFDLDGNEIVVPTYDDNGEALLWIRRDYDKGAPTTQAITYYECTSEDGTQYYLFSRKTSESITVDSNYAFSFKSGVGINNNIVVMNLDGIAHSDGTGVQYFGFTMRNNILKYVYFPQSIKSTKSLTAASNTNNKQVFLGDANLSQVEFALGSQITELSPAAFQGCALTEVILPDGLTYIDERAFDACTSLKKIYIPRTVTFIDEIAFRGVTDAEYYFTGVEETTNGWEITDEIRYVNHCDVYYDGEHSCEDDGDCSTVLICERCEKALEADISLHNIQTVIKYDNGYANDGYKKNVCSICSSFVESESVVSPLFTCLGYSVGPDAYSLQAGYMVNVDAINAYKEFYPDFSFGVVIANANTVKSEESFFANEVINSSAKGIMVRVDDLQYSILNVDISKFNASMADSLELVVGIYTNDGEGNMAVCQHINADYYTTTKTYSDMSLNAITFNQVRIAHDMDALVPVAPSKLGEE